MASQFNSTPLATVRAFLASIKTRSKETMTALSHPDATACIINDGKPMHLQLSQVVQGLLDSSSEMDEVPHDEIEHVDGDFASCWAPYKIHADGKLDLSGTDAFTLWKDPERGWVITAVAYIARKN